LPAAIEESKEFLGVVRGLEPLTYGL